VTSLSHHKDEPFNSPKCCKTFENICKIHTFYTYFNRRKIFINANNELLDTVYKFFNYLLFTFTLPDPIYLCVLCKIFNHPYWKGNHPFEGLPTARRDSCKPLRGYADRSKGFQPLEGRGSVSPFEGFQPLEGETLKTKEANLSAASFVSIDSY